jgi:hypothetical protein
MQGNGNVGHDNGGHGIAVSLPKDHILGTRHCRLLIFGNICRLLIFYSLPDSGLRTS